MVKIIFPVLCLLSLAADAELTPPTWEDVFVMDRSSTAQSDSVGNNYTENSSSSATQMYSENGKYKETIPPELKDIVVREGKKLTVKKGDKILAEFKDDDDGETIYRFTNYNKKNNSILVFTYYYEYSDATLINYASEKKTVIADTPIWSPSEFRFATVFSDEHGEGISVVAIWHIEKGKFIKKSESKTWPMEKNAMFLYSAKWISENELSFSGSKGGLNCKYKDAKWVCKRFASPPQ